MVSQTTRGSDTAIHRRVKAVGVCAQRPAAAAFADVVSLRRATAVDDEGVLRLAAARVALVGEAVGEAPSGPALSARDDEERVLTMVGV